MMKASAPTATPGGQREFLADVIPLETPYLVQMFPAYACNFKCEFCVYALEPEKRGYISDCVYMDFALYKKAIDDMKRFSKRIKMLRFAAMGEPLLHKQIVDMVAYAKQSDVAESIDIVTNGSRLTKELSAGLIDAGLSKLRISLEGLSSEEYREHAKAEVDFDQLIENIRYFYENTKGTQLYVKIIDYMVKTETEKQRFFELLTPISHHAAIEHLTPTISEIDYDTISDGITTNKAQNGEQLFKSNICPQPFYIMQINPDGNVVPCCSVKYPRILGNVQEQPVDEIWNGEKFMSFRKALLISNANAGDVCKECNLYLYGMYAEDVLDAHADKLLKKLSME